MSIEWRLEVKTPDGQNVLEFHELDSREVGNKLTTVADLMAESDWKYLEFEVLKGKNQ